MVPDTTQTECNQRRCSVKLPEAVDNYGIE